MDSRLIQEKLMNSLLTEDLDEENKSLFQQILKENTLKMTPESMNNLMIEKDYYMTQNEILKLELKRKDIQIEQNQVATINQEQFCKFWKT